MCHSLNRYRISSSCSIDDSAGSIVRVFGFGPCGHLPCLKLSQLAPPEPSACARVHGSRSESPSACGAPFRLPLRDLRRQPAGSCLNFTKRADSAGAGNGRPRMLQGAFSRCPMRAALLVEKAVQAEVKRRAGERRGLGAERHRNILPLEEDRRANCGRSRKGVKRPREVLNNRVRQDATKNGRTVLRRTGCGVAHSASGIWRSCGIRRGANGQCSKARAPEQQEGQQTGAVRGSV